MKKIFSLKLDRIFYTSISLRGIALFVILAGVTCQSLAREELVDYSPNSSVQARSWMPASMQGWGSSLKNWCSSWSGNCCRRKKGQNLVVSATKHRNSGTGIRPLVKTPSTIYMINPICSQGNGDMGRNEDERKLNADTVGDWDSPKQTEPVRRTSSLAVIMRKFSGVNGAISRNLSGSPIINVEDILNLNIKTLPLLTSGTIEPGLASFLELVDRRAFQRLGDLRDQNYAAIGGYLFMVSFGGAMAYSWFQVNNWNWTAEWQPVWGMSPVLEKNKKGSGADLFNWLELAPIHAFGYVPAAGAMILLVEKGIRGVRNIKTSLEISGKATNWKYYGAMTGVVLASGISSLLETVVYYSSQKAWGTFGRNGVNTYFYPVLEIGSHIFPMRASLDDLFLMRRFRGESEQVSQRRNILHSLILKGEWTVRQYDSKEAGLLYQLLTHESGSDSKDFAAKTLGTSMRRLLGISKKDERARRVQQLTENYLKDTPLEVSLSELKSITTGIDNIRQKAAEQELRSAAFIKLALQGTDKASLRAHKVLMMLSLGQKLDQEFNQGGFYSELERDEKVRQGLLWGGRILGFSAIYGFTKSWQLVLEEAGIARGVALPLVLSLSRIASGNVFGHFLVNTYDRWTNFRYPNAVGTEMPRDIYTNQSGSWRHPLSLLAPAAFSLVNVGLALQTSGYKWTTDPENANVTYDPHNIAFWKALLPVLPMVPVIAGSTARFLSQGMGHLINRFQWVRVMKNDDASQLNDLRKAELGKVFEQVRRDIIYASPEVIEQLWQLTRSKPVSSHA